MEAEQVYEKLWREAKQEIDALKEERGKLRCEISQLHAQISSIRAAHARGPAYYPNRR